MNRAEFVEKMDAAYMRVGSGAVGYSCYAINLAVTGWRYPSGPVAARYCEMFNDSTIGNIGSWLSSLHGLCLSSHPETLKTIRLTMLALFKEHQLTDAEEYSI